MKRPPCYGEPHPPGRPGRWTRSGAAALKAGSTSLLLAISSIAGFAADPYALNGITPSEKLEVALPLPTNGVVQLGLFRLSPSAPAQVVLYASPFASGGEALEVRLAESNLVFQTDAVFAPAEFKVKGGRPGLKYSGSIVLAASGVAPQVWRVSLIQSNAPGPVIVVEPPTLKHFIVRRSWWQRRSQDPQISVAVREQSGALPLERIGVSVASIRAPDRANFSPPQHINFFWNGTRVTHMQSSSAAADSDKNAANARSLAPGARGSIGMNFGDLDVGDYTVELKVFADGAQEASTQKVTLTLQVSDPPWRAVVTLLLAILCSFVAYKALGQFRERLQLRQRAAAAKPVAPFYTKPVYTVVWVKMVLRYADDLARRWLIPTATITERLQQMQPVAAALREAGRAEEYLRDKDPLVANRFNALINDWVRTISDSNMTGPAVEKAQAALADLAASLANDQWHDRYIGEVKKAIAAFLAAVGPAQLPPEAHDMRSALETEAQTLDAANGLNPAERLRRYKEQETRYAKLNLLHQRRQFPKEQKQLIAQLDEQLEDYFFTADSQAWARIKSAQPTIEMSQLDSTESPEAFQPLRFNVVTTDEHSNQSYLFNRGLSYHWTFKFRRDRSPLWNWFGAIWERLRWSLLSRQPGPADLHLTPTTRSPRIAQFSPWPGTLQVSAKIVCSLQHSAGRLDDEIKVHEVTKTIRHSSEVSLLNGLGTAELMALMFSAVIALVSGFLTYYYKNPVFGTVQDYISLFLWGVGVEQSKNFLQTLQSTKQEAKSGG